MKYVKKTLVYEALHRLVHEHKTQDVHSAILQWYTDKTGKKPSAKVTRRVYKMLDEWQAVQDRYMEQEVADAEEAEAEEPFVPGGVMQSDEDLRLVSTDRTFILTCAQGNTRLNDNFWSTLKHMSEYLGATLMVSRFTYNKATMGQNSVKPGTKRASDTDDLWYDERILPYTSDEQIQIAPGLVWCGDLNISPTRVDPIESFGDLGRGASVVVPHVKMAMRSWPRMPGKSPRLGYTTGTVTQRNYIECAAGQKASLHHVYGALLVEVDDDGTWWARQLNADSSGAVSDLNYHYTPSGTVTKVDRCEAIIFGDVHGHKVNMDQLRACEEVVDHLYPEHQVFHDTVDFYPRNHHNMKDPWHFAEAHARKATSVEQEFRDTAFLLNGYLGRPNTFHLFVTSNHDQAIEAWLRNPDALKDPENAKLWHRLNYEMHAAIEGTNGRARFRPFAHLWKKSWRAVSQYHARVINEDESFKLSDIELGLHGHLGANGSRGNPKTLRAVGKAVTAHTHAMGIYDGVYVTGVMGDLKMGYNKGLTSWTHGLVVQHKGGKRQACVMKKGRIARAY